MHDSPFFFKKNVIFELIFVGLNLQEANPIRKLEAYNDSPDSTSNKQQKIEQLSRITIVIEDASQNHGLVNNNN